MGAAWAPAEWTTIFNVVYEFHLLPPAVDGIHNKLFPIDKLLQLLKR